MVKEYILRRKLKSASIYFDYNGERLKITFSDGDENTVLPRFYTDVIKKQSAIESSQLYADGIIELSSGEGGGGGDATWGNIGGNINNQRDLNEEFLKKLVFLKDQIPVADEQGNLVDSGNKFLESTSDVRSYDESEDTKIPTEKFLQKTLHNIEEPEEDKDAVNKKYVDDLISELSGKVLRFKGFVSTTAPTGTIKEGTLWFESATLPTTFPINVKTYNATTRRWSTTTTEYTPESLDLWANLNDDKGYYWFGNGWNMIDDNGKFVYVSTFEGVVGNPQTLYYLDTAYSTYEKGFYRFIPASGGNPEKFILLNKELFKYVSTFEGETGDVDRLYFLDTKYDDYKVGFYRYIEAQGTTPAKFVQINIAELSESISYSELKTLRNSEELVPGKWYRITDYVTTTIQANTQSAGHQFDIIVQAQDVNALSETAYATLHEGDTYFANSELSAWELKYCLDNDTNRFVWAAPNGKGVVYYMKDEFNNKCPYDFKNIQFKRFKIDSCTKIPVLVGTYLGISGIDTYTIDSNDSIWCFTFSSNSAGGEQTDQSMSKTNNVYSNVIGIRVGANQMLNNIVFYGNGCHSNTFGNNCYNNTFSTNCYNNTFGNYFQNNTFSNNCYNNTFGNSCSNNTFGTYCSNNTFRNSCNNNTFGNSCSNNTFGSYYQGNTFGNICSNNTFGIYCQNNIFNNNCYSNTYGTYCQSNTFSNYCYSNTFGNYCSSNTFGTYCQNSTFGNNCSNNTFNNNYRFVLVDNGVGYTNVLPVSITGSNSYLQNIKILSGVKGTASERRVLNFLVNKDYLQVAGMTSDGQLRIWNPADIAESDVTIIDVISLPTENIDTDAIYRLTTVHYYHNDTELAAEPQGYKSLDEEAVVINENGITVTSSSTTTPWSEVTDVFLQTLITGSLVSTCDYVDASFFKLDTNSYDFGGNFSTADTFTLWHNATGDPADWEEVSSVANLVTDGKTTEEVNGELQANAIIDVDVLPTTDIKEKTFYRKKNEHFYDVNDNEVIPVAKYICDGDHVEAQAVGLIDKSTLVPTPWSAVTDTIVDDYITAGYITVTETIGNTPYSLYFIKTGENSYSHIMCISNKVLYHHEDGAWKLVSEDATPDNTTIEVVSDKLQANAILDVTTLPTDNIKAKTLYRMYVHRYLEDGEPLANTPTGYVTNRPAIVIIDENGITDDGTLYPWADLDDDQMDRFLNRSQIREVPASELMTTSTCFRTATDHYVYKDHVTEEEVYELYHNPTATANEFIKVGGGGSAEVDDVTVKEVDGKLQANAIVEVQSLPSTGYKQNSLYRMLDTATQTFKRYYYNGSSDPLPETPTFYKGDGEHLVFSADGYTLNGGRGSYSSISEITLSVWMNNGWVSETTDFSEAGMFRMPGSLAVYDSTTKLTEEDYVITAEMDKVFKRIQGGWECISYIQLDKEQYDILSEVQKNDGTLYIVNDEEE